MTLPEQMEDCVHLVCESLGVREEDEVNVEMVCVLYQKVFLTAPNLDDTQRAITQVSAQNAGLPCTGRLVLHVLLVMERERESREKLYWELQMLKSGRISTSAGIKSQPLFQHYVYKQQNMRQKQDTKQWSTMGLLGNSKRLYLRLNLDGVRSVLPSLSHGHIADRPLGWMSPTTSDILLLLQYKYDVIKEQLYREMLQEEHGVAWWETVAPQEEWDCVCKLREAAEQALMQMDFLHLCELPGALRCYRSGGQVILQACEEGVKPRDQAWTSKPREQAWSAVVFLTELDSHHQQERDSLTVLLNRAERAVLMEIYLSVCVAVRRAERETHSHIALLASRQYWDKWPYTRGTVSQELSKFWLQEKQNPSKRFQGDWKTASCTQQQTVLQCLVLCQEQERQSLLEILHTLSLKELRDQRDTLPPACTAAEMSPASLRQSCVLSLREIKASLLEVSWADCSIHLLTQLTMAHEYETWTVMRSLPAMDARGITALLHKYESELNFPKLQNLYELLQPSTSRSMDTANTVTSTDGERTEQRQHDPTESETQALCSGCGVVLMPEDAPYLEILGPRDQRDEENTERMNEEAETRGEVAGESIELGKEEERGGSEDKREEEKAGLSEGAEGREVEISLEKQGSLITLAWSKPADAVSKDQDRSAALPEELSAAIPTDLHTQISTQQVHGDSIKTPNELHSHTHLEDTGSPLSQLQEQTHTEQPVQRTVEEHTLVQAVQDDSTSTSTMEVEGDGTIMDEHPDTQHTTTSEADPHGATQAHTSVSVEIEAACEGKEVELVCQGEEKSEEVCVNVCEEQQLQREATMRSLVHIQRRAERRWQRDRDRQLLRVQERLAIIQNRKSDEDLLGLTQEDTFRHLTSTLQQEDEQLQKTLVREKLQQLRRERSYILQTRRERNTAGFKELLAPTAQHMTNTEDGL